ncbi:RNA polymerase sigma factor [Lysobacter sp.]|uniref:RNA polymerase sigma factor n=1 Tax=Lysobacter sp. TaxID=72226 RepID=UPI002D3E99DC|nr:sigma-70 family RNA polymerase sigma factor [Lysobacter sp.]HZX78191.1 sigma-70 family RNA polymerase sigma factor [Lysobacter sp.]
MSTSASPSLIDFLTLRYDDLRRRLTRRLGSAELASDALQDTWLRLHGKPVADAVSPGAYLFRMAFNVAIDRQRSESRRLTTAEIDDLLDVADPSPDPADSAQTRSDLEMLVQAMEELPERRRAILLAVRVEGLTQPEVARRFGVSLRLVELELQRAQEYCASRVDR